MAAFPEKTVKCILKSTGLKLTLLITLLAFGCSMNSLSELPGNRTTFLLTYDASKVQENPNLLSKLKMVVTNRFSRLGTKVYCEQASTNQIRVVIPAIGKNEIEAARSFIARPGLLEFRLIHEQSDELIQKGVRDDEYEMLTLKQRAPDGVLRTTSFLVKRKPEITGQYIQSAHPSHDQLGLPELDFRLKPEGAKLFGRITAGNIGRRLAIVLDGQLLSAPRIATAINGGHGVITCSDWTDREVTDVACILENPLPFPVTTQ